jgi:hypothetical protein
MPPSEARKRKRKRGHSGGALSPGSTRSCGGARALLRANKTENAMKKLTQLVGYKCTRYNIQYFKYIFDVFFSLLGRPFFPSVNERESGEGARRDA